MRAWLALGVLSGAGLPAKESAPLTWEVSPAEVRGEADQLEATVAVRLRNPTDLPVEIREIKSSCGCTVLQGPVLPWTLAPGAAGELAARVDLRGRHGELHKTLAISTSRGLAVIPIRIAIPAPAMSEERLRNQLVALADARAIFRGDCAMCHAAPAAGKKGPELYRAACAICHEAEPRASSVPDLRVISEARPAEYWRKWIEEGKAGSLMPPFAGDRGGILDEAQVRSLVEFLRERR